MSPITTFDQARGVQSSGWRHAVIEDVRRLPPRAAGYDVVEAHDGTELRELIDSLVLRPQGQTAVELLIADVRMPGATGLSVLSELRRSDWNTPVILMSAFPDDELSAEAARLGALVLDKPFDLRELLSFVRQNTGIVR